MTKKRLEHLNPKSVRDTLNHACVLAHEIQLKENELIAALHHIDQQRLYLRYGYKSLQGFCHLGLKFSRTQSQRITTRVRRTLPMANIGQ